MLKFCVTGRWVEERVRTRWGESSRVLDAQIERVIERRWNEAIRRPGIQLFDGPMCRLERWSLNGEALEIDLSPTSYGIFFGTNLGGHAREIDPRCRANALGASAGLLTRDGQLMLGHRSATVAYHPNRIHPFAGTIEPRDGGNVFAAVRRELHEELAIDPTSIESITCVGLVEDVSLAQPELIFITRVDLPRDRIERQVDPAEHGRAFSIRADAAEIDRALSVATSSMTPVAVATLLLVGKELGGDKWFEVQRRRFTTA